MSSPTITMNPADGSLGVGINQQIEIIFDTSIDLGSINDGNIIVTGVVDQIWSGPDMIMFETLTSESYNPYLLSAPTLTGVLNYDIETSRVDSSGSPVSILDDGTDINAGNLFYTKVVLTPNVILKENTKYGIIISSDITTNTVFDPIYTFDSSSSGVVAFVGPYTGAAADAFVVTITGGTTYSDLTFDWYKTSDPGTVTSVNSANLRNVYLSDGVNILFSTGTFNVGDSVQCNVVPADYLDNIYTASFVTGVGNYAVPESGEPKVIDEINFLTPIGSSINNQSSCVKVISTLPTNDQYQVATSTSQIQIKFASTIDAQSIDLSKIHITQEQLIANDIFCQADQFLTDVVVNNISISGDTVIISIGTLKASSVVNVVLDEGFVTSNSVKSCSLNYVFMTSFPYFFTTPAYIEARGGGVLGSVPNILIAEKIGILSTNLQNLLVTCFKEICNKPTDFKAYYSTMVRDYISDSILMQILENSNRLVSMSKAIDSFRVSFGGNNSGTGGQSGVMYDSLKKNIDNLLRGIRSCGKLGPGQSVTPVSFEKSADSCTPAVRGRTVYDNGLVPGLNSTVRTVNTRSKAWRNRRGY